MNTSSCPSKQMSALYYQSHFVWKTCSQFPFLRASMPAWRQCLLFRFYIIRRKNMTCRSSSRKKLSIWKLLLLEVIGIDIFHVAILPHKWKKEGFSTLFRHSGVVNHPYTTYFFVPYLERQGCMYYIKLFLISSVWSQPKSCYFIINKGEKNFGYAYTSEIRITVCVTGQPFQNILQLDGDGYMGRKSQHIMLPMAHICWQMIVLWWRG